MLHIGEDEGDGGDYETQPNCGHATSSDIAAVMQGRVHPSDPRCKRKLGAARLTGAASTANDDDEVVIETTDQHRAERSSPAAASCNDDARAHLLRHHLQSAAARLNFPGARAMGDALVAAQQQQHRSSSRYRGVSWNKNKRKWTACVTHQDRTQHLGTFSDEESAARAYDAQARLLHGAAARLNFPRAGER
eukprot:COSAG01_NODE_10357_length_2185_cov_19.300575_4_plen_191_part_01